MPRRLAEAIPSESATASHCSLVVIWKGHMVLYPEETAAKLMGGGGGEAIMRQMQRLLQRSHWPL